eukprot:GSChrysophyteH2.ASY1.ANO1.875.1 assembled CDS
MGIDLVAGGRRKGHNVRKAPASKNVYIKLLEKLYGFIARRADSKFAGTIVKRLRMSRINTPPLSVSRLSRFMKGDDKIGKIAVVFTDEARKAITRSGGECMTFDQLALVAPKGSNTVLLRGAKNAREAVKHFGHATSPDNPHTHDGVKPYVRSKGRKFEKARGRRASTGFKV